MRREALAELPEAFGATHDDWAGRPLADIASHLDDHCVFGAFRDEALIGTMALDCSDAAGEVSAVYVHPECRGKGIGRALLKALSKEARGRDLSQLMLAVAETNVAALRFYRGAGFSNSNQPSRALTRDGRLLDLVTMTKAL